MCRVEVVASPNSHGPRVNRTEPLCGFYFFLWEGGGRGFGGILKSIITAKIISQRSLCCRLPEGCP